MEAANLGAYAAPLPDEMLDEALELLGQGPVVRPVGHRLGAGRLRVRERWPGGGDSVGIPTWFYGHEPPNAFAVAHREVLRQRHPRGRPAGPLATRAWSSCRAPPAPSRRSSTTRRPNYYESRGEPDPDGAGRPRPLDRRLPTWPLLQALAEGGPWRPGSPWSTRSTRHPRRSSLRQGPCGAARSVPVRVVSVPFRAPGAAPGSALVRPGRRPLAGWDRPHGVRGGGGHRGSWTLPQQITLDLPGARPR